MAWNQELEQLQEQLDLLRSRIADCADDIARSKKSLSQFLREVQKQARRFEELEKLKRKSAELSTEDPPATPPSPPAA